MATKVQVPSRVDAAAAAELLPKLLAERERIATELEAARERFERETAGLRGDLQEVNSGLGRVASAIQAVAAESGQRGGGGWRDELAAHVAQNPRTWFSAKELAQAVGVPTGPKLTRGLNALVEDGRLSKRGRGVGTQYRAK